MKAPARHRFKRVGTMSYEVYLLDDTAALLGQAEATPPQLLGSLWRTREGWRYRAPGQPISEAYGVSRGVAAGLLEQAATADIETATVDGVTLYVWHGHFRARLIAMLAYRAEAQATLVTMNAHQAQLREIEGDDDNEEEDS